MNTLKTPARLAIRKASVSHFEPVLTAGAAPLLERVFAETELASFRRNKGGAESLAARYAAKAALLEVLGIPEAHLDAIGSSIELGRLPSGQPSLVCRDPVQAPPGTHITLSLTHSRTLAVAAVALQPMHSAEHE